jgi:hypothetical protein
MSDKNKKEANAAAAAAMAAAASAGQQYDPATLLALYSMSNAYGMGNAAASTASSNSGSFASNQLGLNQWYTMASQLAAQEYLTRIQAAARDPQAYAALAAQGVLPNYEMLTGGSKARLKLPTDTEIIKYTSSATGSKEPGTSTRGRKKTISLDPNLSAADYASLAANVSSSSNESTPPPIPAGLTIERKRPTSAASSASTTPSVDRVEITKIPASNGSSSFMPKSSTPKAASTSAESPLNLSTKSSAASPFMSPISSTASVTVTSSGADYTSKSIGGSKIPQEYYACKLIGS